MTGSATWLRRAAFAVASHAAGVMPSLRASWADAVQQEVHHIPDDHAALEWALGCLLESYRKRAKMMDIYQRVNRIGSVAPTIMSILALAIAVVVVTTGWDRHLNDEGTAVHLFQILIVGQLPFIIGYLATANWQRPTHFLRPMIYQIAALSLALGSVALFKL
jgi:hypothetical protein